MTASRLKILFVSRAYPPVIGGIERQNFELHRALSRMASVELIANTRGKRNLPVFYAQALFRGLVAAPRADVVLLGDAVLAPLGWLLGLVSRKPVCCVVHGLDVTYRNRLYQAVWVKFALRRMAMLFAVGRETIRQALARGIDEKLCRFIPNGVDESATGDGSAVTPSGRIEKQPGKFYLLTLGRLVERRGVPWFLQQVFPRLDDDICYWIAGDGPCRAAVQQAVAALPEPSRVTVFGQVSDEEKTALLQQADLFVQPNIPVAGDMEGFGLVVLEAASAGLPVVASRLEGLCDAIIEGENGILLDTGDAGAYADCIAGFAARPREASAFGERARAYTRAHCSWDRIARCYLDELESVTAGPSGP